VLVLVASAAERFTTRHCAVELAGNHHQRKVLHAIFAHPVNANLNLKDVTNVLTGLGAEIDAKAKSRIGVKLNGRSTILHRDAFDHDWRGH
jgi:hypothetical protein